MSEASADRFQVKFAVYLIARDGEKILMLKRFNTGYQDGNYGLVSGHSDGGETAQQAMIREAKEEAGIDVRPEDIRVVHVQHSPAEDSAGEYLCVFMETSKWAGEPKNLEPEKCSEIAWFSTLQLPENTIPAVRSALENIEKGIFYSNWGWDE